MKEDYYTNTPEDARLWQQYYGEQEEDPDRPDPRDFIDEDEDEDYDECNCSDPGCPCTGHKTGTL